MSNSFQRENKKNRSNTFSSKLQQWIEKNAVLSSKIGVEVMKVHEVNAKD